MAKLYVTADTDAIRTLRTARGHHWTRAAVQSWDGSIAVTLNEAGQVGIYAGPGSTPAPSRMLYAGPLADMLAADRLRPANRDTDRDTAALLHGMASALSNLLAWLEDAHLDKTPAGGYGPFAYEGTEYSVVTDARAALAAYTDR